MAYSSKGRLPYETASKLGHIKIVESEWIRSLLNDFETDDLRDDALYDESIWKTFDPKSAQPLKQIWVSDGGLSEERQNGKELAYVKTALLTIDPNKLTALDPEFPHPLIMQNIMRDIALIHPTVFPLKNIKNPSMNLYDTVRHVIYDSIHNDQNGLYFETLKWIVYKKWSDVHVSSPGFICPHCFNNVKGGFPYDLDTYDCPFCKKEVLLTDMIGFPLDMNEDTAKRVIADRYMSIMELLMLFTVIRLQWDNKDKNLVRDTLFIRDGSMVFFGQYAKIVPRLRDFLAFAKNQNRPIHIVSAEKSGEFADYLDLASRFVTEEQGKIQYAIPNHGYIRHVIQRAANIEVSYGLKTNWGERVFVCLDRNTHLVLNLTAGIYREEDDFPQEEELIGLDRILATIPSLINHMHENALYPVVLANGAASLAVSSSPILQKFTEDQLENKHS